MTSYNTAVLADSPTLYFPMDGGTAGSGSGSDVSWTSSRASSVTWTTGIGGVASGAPVFDGSTSYIEYTHTGNTTLFNGGTWSIELWFKKANTTDAAAYRELFNCYDSGNNNQAVFYGDDGTGHIGFWYNMSNVGRIKLTGPLINDMNWHHAVATSDGTTVRLYVDNVMVASNTAHTGNMATSCPIWLGGYGTGSNNENWHGEIDEVAVWNSKALTATQVQNHYAAGGGVINKTVTPPAMLANPLTMVAPTVSIITPVNKTISAGVMNMGPVTAPAPTIKPYTTLAETNSSGSNGTAGSTFNFGVGSGYFVNYQFGNITVPSGKQIVSATLNVDVGNAGAGTATAGHTIPYTIDRYTTTFGSGALSTTHEVTGTITVPASAATAAIDITGIVKDMAVGSANHGIKISGSASGGTASAGEYVAFSDTTSGGFKPYVSVLVQDIPPTPVTVSAPVATASLTAVAPVVTAVKNATVVAPVATLSLSEIAPAVSAQKNVAVISPVVTAAIAFPGGKAENPDHMETPVPMTGSLSMVAPTLIISKPVTVAVPPMTASVADVPATVNLVTNKVNMVKPMTGSLSMVGIYNLASDPYMQQLPATLDQDDIWYKLDEASGNRAIDNESGFGTSTPPNVIWQQSGWLFGNPTRQIPDGPQLRKATRFNGSTDYLIVGPYSMTNKYAAMEDNTIPANDVNSEMAMTVEFSIRTTQTDGVVYVGTGAGSSQLAAISPTATDRPTLNGNEIRLIAGELVIFNTTKSVKVREFIADGQWHHIVVAFPAGGQTTGSTSGAYDAVQPNYVAIDGKPALVRYGGFLGDSKSFGEYWLPYSFMARATPNWNANTGDPIASTTVNGFLAGDLRDVIVRLNNYTPLPQAESLYYAWSDSTVINPTPMSVSASMVAPAKVKGNIKKMLAVYGLPWGYDTTNTQYPLYNYLSNLSGMVIENMNAQIGAAGSVSPDQTAGGTVHYYAPKSFMMDGYMVYPVSIVGDSTINGVSSVGGVISPDAVTNFDGTFVDDETGLPRFINLQNDLSGSVTDYDVVTVVNYPWESPNATVPHKNYLEGSVPDGDSLEPQDAHPIQHSMGLSNDEWSRARDALRDSILQAAYDGVSLWIGEYHMAQHLEFVQGIDIHDPGYFFGNGRSSAYENTEAQLVDQAHLPTQIGPFYTYIAQGNGYYANGQLNFYRRIVALEPGLTDLPSNEMGAQVEGWNLDEFYPNGNFFAYEIVRRPNGLQVGDQTLMSMKYLGSEWIGSDYGQNQISGPQNLRAAVISAHPDGIVGKVIAREMQSYYGPNGVVVPNKYANNAVTIAAEVGSVVRGQAIHGRVFIEFMDTNTASTYLREDADKRLWGGDYTAYNQYNVNPSTWDFDSRRSKEVKIEITSSTGTFDPSSGQIITNVQKYDYFTYTDAASIWNKQETMHSRGLNWLAQTPAFNPDDAIVYAQPMAISAAAVAPKVTTVKNTTVQVTGTMRGWLEARQPANYQDGNILVYALPMEMDLAMRGTGSVIKVSPAALTMSAVAPTVKGQVEYLNVFLDADRSITLYLKEDN